MHEKEQKLQPLQNADEKRKPVLVDIFSAPCRQIDDKKKEAFLVSMLLSKFEQIAENSAANEKNKIWKS